MKKVLLIIIALLLLLAIPLTVFFVSQRQELRKRAAPATTLSLSPATATKKIGETFSLDVKIDTGENQVVAADIALSFDPEKLQAETITNGALFPNILTSGSVASGSATIAVGAQNTSQPVKGTGTAAVVRFKALATTESPVSVRFASSTFVGGLGEGSTNVLVGTSPAKITITGDSGTTPTPTPTLSLNQESSGSAQATSSALVITNPAKNKSVSDDQPTISGKAPPGATVTLTIYSTPTTVTVKADSNGNWSYIPPTPLTQGSHTVVASALDPQSGKTLTSSSAFVVAAAGSEGSTISATPVAGTIEITYLLLGFGTLLFTGGFLSLHYGKRF